MAGTALRILRAHFLVVRALMRNVIRKWNMCWRSLLGTLQVSDRSRCGAVLVVSDFGPVGSSSLWSSANFNIARSQPARHVARVRLLSLWRGAGFDIAPAVRVESVLLWSCADFSCFSWILVKRFFGYFGRSCYDDPARVSWCSLRGP